MAQLEHEVQLTKTVYMYRVPIIPHYPSTQTQVSPRHNNASVIAINASR